MATPDQEAGPSFHNPSETALGSTESNDRVVTNYKGDPATIKAGLVCSLNAGVLEVGHANSPRIGISLGAGLSKTEDQVAVCRSGSRVPLQVTQDGGVGGDDYSHVVIGAPVSVLAATGKASGDDLADETGAIYVSGVISGVDKNGDKVDCVLVDLRAGL